MDVLILTVGVSLITQLIGMDEALSAIDGEVIAGHQYATIASPQLTDVLTRTSLYLDEHMALIPQAHELIATRKYVHRMTGHNTLCLPHTDYVLLALDTVVGRFCAERIKTAIEAVVTDVDVSIRYLPDLQPLDIEGLHHGWEHLCITLDAIHRHYKSDVIYNITGEFSVFAGLMHGYATRIGTRMIYTFNPHAPLVIIDVSPHGNPADITFYQDNAS